MSEHRATIAWKSAASSEDFCKGKYSREHTWTFDGGITVPGSPSPSVVPAPWSNAAYVDPEEAYVAAISSCHMLTFLYVAAKAGFVVTSYRDDAVGTLAMTEKRVAWIDRVTLHPEISYAGDKLPTPADSERLHHAAHAGCFIANSIKTEVVIAPH